MGQGPRSVVPDRALPKKPKSNAWKQKAIQIQPDDYYLNQIKAARGLSEDGKQKPVAVASSPKGGSNGHAAARATDASSGGYGKQVRQRASDIEAEQRREEGARIERGCAVLQRVQQRATRTSSAESRSSSQA